MSYENAPWEYDDTELPTCPHCDNEIEEWWETNIADDESTTIKCKKCSKKFGLIRHDNPKFSSAPTEEDL